MSTTKLIKEQLIDAAVAVVQEHAKKALEADPGDHSEYIEAYQVAAVLQDQGVISHEHADASSPSWRDQARKSVEGKVKRLLDAEAAKSDARILRLSSRDHGHLPRLDGRSRGFYGQAVGYTTPELYARAEAATRSAEEQYAGQQQEATALRERAAALGLPEPIHPKLADPRVTVTYDLAGLRMLIKRLERLGG